MKVVYNRQGTGSDRTIFPGNYSVMIYCLHPDRFRLILLQESLQEIRFRFRLSKGKLKSGCCS